MTQAPKDDQLDLFPGKAPAPAAVPIRPWRTIPPADLLGELEPEHLESFLIDLLQRDGELLKALKLVDVPEDSPDIERFLRREAQLVDLALELRRGELPAPTRRNLLFAALEIADSLAEIRVQILEGLDPEPRERALNAEPQFRTDDHVVRRELAELELLFAEEQEAMAEIMMPLAQDEELPSGVLGLADVDAFAQYSMGAWKDEQDQRPLPRQLKLRTLLKGIPTVWLDPMCGVLGIDPRKFKLRKDREQAVAHTLTDVDRLQSIVRDKLSAEERELVLYLLDKGGQPSSGLVTRRFGTDAEDGWFWHEQPPTSVLGRVRLHGLAFVGRLPTKGRMVRTVAIPRELREPLDAAL